MYLRERLVVFKSSFMEQDGHGVLYRNVINVFEGISDGGHRYFKFIF